MPEKINVAKREIGGRIVSTPEQILTAALRLFNQHGAGQVTVRQVAQEAGISHGNLCYHFSNTDALVQRLYEEFVARLNTALERALERPTLSLAFLLGLTRDTFGLLDEYRFLLLDFSTVMRRLPAVRDHYRALQDIRARQFRLLFDGLVQAGVLRSELSPGQFEWLTLHLILFGDAWVNHAEFFYQGREAEKPEYYLRLFAALLTPYLTEKGLAEFRQMNLV